MLFSCCSLVALFVHILFNCCLLFVQYCPHAFMFKVNSRAGVAPLNATVGPPSARRAPHIVLCFASPLQRLGPAGRPPRSSASEKEIHSPERVWVAFRRIFELPLNRVQAFAVHMSKWHRLIGSHLHVEQICRTCADPPILVPPHSNPSQLWSPMWSNIGKKPERSRSIVNTGKRVILTRFGATYEIGCVRYGRRVRKISTSRQSRTLNMRCIHLRVHPWKHRYIVNHGGDT